MKPIGPSGSAPPLLTEACPPRSRRRRAAFRHEGPGGYLLCAEHRLRPCAAGNPEAAESDLFAFCKALPKGGELHSHGFTAASLDSVIDLLIDYQGGEVAICLEEGDKYGCLYAPGVDTDVKTVPLKAALKEGALTREQLHGMLSVEPGQTPRGRGRRGQRDWDNPVTNRTDLPGDGVCPKVTDFRLEYRRDGSLCFHAL